jgi:curved DNA-binding protein CbpA
MQKETYSFNELEFNLYELMNLSVSCSTEDVKKKFKKIIKKFHPDKITKLEEKLYYNITLAYQILSNPESKTKYDMWLLNSNVSHMSLKNEHKEDKLNVRSYFPPTQKEAQVEFAKISNDLLKKHGNYIDDTRNIASIYKDKEKHRNNIPEIIKETFSNMKDFNNKFVERKKNGVYCDKLVKLDTTIIPYESKNPGFAELKDFNNIYKKTNTINHAFSLMNVDNAINYDVDPATLVDEYNNTTKQINNNISLDDIGI